MFAALFGGDVDITPVTNSVLSILGLGLGVLANWAGWHFRKWMSNKVDLSKTQLDDQIQQMFNEASQRSIDFATGALGGVIPKKLTIDSPFIAMAAKYLVNRWPELMVKAHLNTEEAIRETILARLPGSEPTIADAIVLAKAGGPATPEPASK